MHIIQSSAKDFSTSDVEDWLHFLNGDIKGFRLNDNTLIQSLSLRINDQQPEQFSFNANGKTYNSDDILSFWYRRGSFRFTDINQSGSLQRLSQRVSTNCNQEQVQLLSGLYHVLHQNKSGNLNSFRENFTNKLINLSKARQAELQIPDTLVTNDLKELMQFSAVHPYVLTKDICFDEIVYRYDEQYSIRIETGVQLLSHEDILLLQNKYKHPIVNAYALYQQYIPKKYELRIFFLKGKFYPMAIFSQANDKTKIDFRNYDYERPNRCVTYQLPEEIESRLLHFMQSIEMNCGSIDIVVTPENNYIFLEVNPVGQFQWLSRNCNYDIEKQIALDMINPNQRNERKYPQ